MGRNPITKHGRDHRPPGTNGPNDPGGHDPITIRATGISSGGTGLDDTILNLGADAFWKYDETAGTVAHDSSGNSNDVTAYPSNPTWGQAAGPPGTLTPLAPAGGGFGGNTGALHYSPLYTTGDFTFAGWSFTNGPSSTGTDVLGKQGSGSAGWLFGMDGSAVSPGSRADLLIRDTGGNHSIQSDNALLVSTWYLLGFTHISGTWRMYVNGALQAATFSGAYTASAGNPIEMLLPFSGMRGSYVTMFDYGLTGAQMLSLYNLAITQGNAPAGTFLESDGVSGSSFQLVTDALVSTSDVTSNNVTSSKHGFAPKSPADATKFLNGDTTPAYAQVKDSDLATTDITTNNVSTSKHGFMLKLPGGTTNFFREDGTWQPASGGGGGGAMTQLADATLAVAAATIDLTSISGSYNHLWLICFLRGTTSATAIATSLRVNNDSGSNYDYQYQLGTNTTSAANRANGTAQILFGDAPAATAPANVFSYATMLVPNYASSSYNKTAQIETNGKFGTGAGDQEIVSISGNWRSTAAITRLTIIPSSGNWDIGSRATLYGLT
jgi:hypothetical protein